MATGTPIDPAIKSEILQKVREEGLSVYKTAQIYNVNYRTIYGWIKKQVDGKDRNLILKNNRLKKSLIQLTGLSVGSQQKYSAQKDKHPAFRDRARM